MVICVSNNNRKSTLSDISKATGLSITTVSRAINGTGYVSEKNKQLVYATKKELGYIPNLIARSLKIQKTNQIMLCLPDNNPFYYDMIAAIDKVCKEKGYSLLLTFYDKDDKEQFKVIKNAHNGFIDALILICLNINERVINELNLLNIAVVLVGYHAFDFLRFNRSFDFVATDTKSGIYTSTKRLIDKGYTKIAYIGMKLNTTTAIERYEGYRMAMKESGIKIIDKYNGFADNYEELGYKIGIEYIRNKDIPEAICAANDMVVLGLFSAFREYGVDITKTIKIIGMDNTFIGEKVTPTISSVDIMSFGLGENAIKLLMSRLENSSLGYQDVLLRPMFIGRESSEA